jgi:NAD(P)-dependent dehydrogenase (short-subunit alcohol dehydrogenase family)
MTSSITKAATSKEQISSHPVAVVTGAAKGIGRALVEVLLDRGYIVIPVVRTQNDLRELFARSPEKIFPVRCDVTEASTESALHDFVEALTGRVDILFNNAGHGATGYGIGNLDLQELDRVMAVHCHGPIRCVRACLPFLKKAPNPLIINISSRFASLEWVASEVVPADQATYCYRIAKAALNMFTSCLSVELKSQGVRVLSIDPGKVKTRFGPKDADVEPIDAARALVDIAENRNETGMFLHASGEKMPW